MSRFALVVVLALVSIGCGDEVPISEESKVAAPSRSAMEIVSNPAASGSGEPFLSAGKDGSLLMSWLEPAGDESHALRFARFSDGNWSEPATIAERKDFFVNWADFPSIVESGSLLVAHWLQKSGDGPYAYDVMLSRSTDGGETWSAGEVLHTDGVEAEHGFVSLVPDGDTVGALWLDGREMTEGLHGHGAGAMTLRFARIHPDGSVSDRQQLDDRVCECCQTSMVKADDGYVAVYRNRSDHEIRDIAFVRETGGKWSEPAIVHDDGWKIAACPVNGPQIDAEGNDVAVAWFTAPEGLSRVMVAFGDGDGLGEPVRVDEGRAIGRVDIAMIGDGRALVVWLGDDGDVLMRIVGNDGSLSPVHTVGRSSSARASGFPRITKLNGVVYVAWTEPEGESRIRLASIHLKEIA